MAFTLVVNRLCYKKVKVMCRKFECREDIQYIIRPKPGPVAKNATPRFATPFFATPNAAPFFATSPGLGLIMYILMTLKLIVLTCCCC